MVLCHCSLKQRAFLSCLIPVCLGALILCGAYIDLDSPTFVGVCVILGSTTISTGLLGMVGVGARLTAAIEVTGPLIAVESILAIILGFLFLVNLVFVRHYVAAPTEAPTKGEMTGTTTTEAPVLARSENIRMLAFLAPRGTAGELFILQHPWIGYSAASLLIVLGILGFFVADILGTFKTELNVDQMVRERKHMWRKQEERTPNTTLSPKDQDADEEKPLLHEEIVV